jgi:hypothetical protein
VHPVLARLCSPIANFMPRCHSAAKYDDNSSSFGGLCGDRYEVAEKIKEGKDGCRREGKIIITGSN